MRAGVILFALSLLGCSLPTQQTRMAGLQDCAALERTGELTPAACELEAAGRVIQVHFASVPAGAEGGAVEVSVLDPDRRVAQRLLETDVSEYLMPSYEDVDGDGRADILMPRVSGNVNTEWGVWINAGDRYLRVGEISGVEVQRTADGYIAVPARSSCCSWNVRYYRLDETGLHHLVTAQVDGEEESPGGRVRSTCSISEAPGLSDLHLDAPSAREKFCAEPASQVFRP
jgi:hypothetical protein